MAASVDGTLIRLSSSRCFFLNPIRWLFRKFFNFNPETWGNDPIWLTHIFQRGWKQTTKHAVYISILYFQNVWRYQPGTLNNNFLMDENGDVQPFPISKDLVNNHPIESAKPFISSWMDGHQVPRGRTRGVDLQHLPNIGTQPLEPRWCSLSTSANFPVSQRHRGTRRFRSAAWKSAYLEGGSSQGLS